MNFQIEFFKWIFLVNLSVNLSVNWSFQHILVIWTLFINLKALNTIGRHVPNVLVFYRITLPIYTIKSNLKHNIDFPHTYSLVGSHPFKFLFADKTVSIYVKYPRIIRIKLFKVMSMCWNQGFILRPKLCLESLLFFF